MDAVNECNKMNAANECSKIWLHCNCMFTPSDLCLLGINWFKVLSFLRDVFFIIAQIVQVAQAMLFKWAGQREQSGRQ